jgi:hypothetical protein
MVAVKLAEKSNYLNKSISYLRNVIIQEYDIKSAGFTVIKSLRLLPEKKISYLETLPKEKRNIKIGLEMKKNPELVKKVNETLELIRKQFMEANNIPEEAVLSIKKDAIFLINQSPKVLIFGDFEFRAKNRYTSYAYLSNKEFLYNGNDNILDVKGLSAESKELGREYFLKDLCRLFRCAERLDSEKLFNVFKNYRSDYLNKRLDRNSYRELDSEKFRIGGHLVDEISEDMLEFVDISQNYINYVLKIFNYII